MNTTKPLFRLCAISALLLAASALQAATFTWGAPQNITGISDVSTNGSLIGAFNVGDTGVSSTTGNGVSFQSFAVPSSSLGATQGNFTISSTSSFNLSNTAFGSANAPFSALSPAYQTLLAAATSNPALFTLTMAGLIVGMQYEFQWWANHSFTGSAAGRQHTASAGNTVTLDDDPSNTNGGVGQYALGTFTADAATQSIVFGGPQQALLNGFQLRRIGGTSAVPESGQTLNLLALSLGGVAFPRRRLAGAPSS